MKGRGRKRSAWAWVLRSRVWVPLAIASALFLGLSCVPALAGPGYTSALVAGLVFPFLVVIAGALDGSAHRREPRVAYARGMVIGLLATALILLISWASGLVMGLCAPGEGTLRLLLGPGVGCLLAGVWGALLGLVFAKKRRSRRYLGAFIAVLTGPGLSALSAGVRFYASPVVFFYDPFAGYFSGAFYDTDLGGLGRLLTFRIGTAAFLLAALGLVFHLSRSEAKDIKWKWPGAVVSGLSVVAVLVFFGITLAGPSLGHWHTGGTIRAEMGRTLETERCEIIFDRTIDRKYAERFGRECDAHVGELGAYFDTKFTERPVVFLFANRRQKRDLMGAANVDMAKPWRQEAYVEPRGYPHPILGHELAHVVSAEFASGLFRVPTNTLLPNAGLIEGLAVAASPRENEDLTSQEWAAAMLQIGVLPPMDELLGVKGFFSQSSSTAYTAAGAFVSWMRQRFGPKAVREWYGGEPLSELTGSSLSELDQEFRTGLSQIPVSAAALKVAKARFDRPGVFGRRCPHVVDRLFREAKSRAKAGDLDGASERCAEVLALDEGHQGALRFRADLAIRAGNTEEGLQELARLAGEQRLPEVFRAGATERMGDVSLVQGDLDGSRRKYREVQGARVGEGPLRSLDIRLSATPQTVLALGEFLVGNSELKRDDVLYAARLAEWSTRDTTDPLPEYLLGRTLWFRNRPEEAAMHLDRALSRPFALPRVEREALWLRLVIACSEQDQAAAKGLLSRFLALPGTSEARISRALAFARRCGIPAAAR